MGIDDSRRVMNGVVRGGRADSNVPAYRALGFSLIVSCMSMSLSGCAMDNPAIPVRLGPHVAAIVSCAERGITPNQCNAVSSRLFRIDTSGRVQLDVAYACDQRAPLSAMEQAGFKVSAHVHVPPYCVIEGWMRPEAIKTLEQMPDLRSISLPAYAISEAPAAE